MNTAIMLGADVIAIAILTFALYLRRHRRRDLMVSYLSVNIGVLAVAAALSGSSAGVGLGLGLFGVLSIIRLRSSELSQHEVAYYFAALALGLIGGIGVTPLWLGITLMAMIVVALWIGGHPSVLPRYRHQQVILDRAISHDASLKLELERVLGGRVHTFEIKQLDLVNDKTLVEVRYEAPLGHAPDIESIPSEQLPDRAASQSSISATPTEFPGASPAPRAQR